MIGLPRAILIGGSAGCVEALLSILPALPTKFMFPIIVVVHQRPNSKSFLSEIFSAKCRMGVKEVEDKAPVELGTIYFAPPSYHLMIEEDFTFALCVDDPVKFSQPAIDVLFETAANVYGVSAVGIILTGANDDGAQGLRAICDAGGVGIVQDARTSLAPQMPLAAQKRCPEARVLTLPEIGEYLQNICEQA
jgi:two-component system chemotaxis response regulator CheB